MKHIALLCLAAGLGCGADLASDDDVSTAPALGVGLVAAYGFDEGTGNVARDSSGNGLDGALAGQARVSGRFGAALQFNSNRVTVPDSAALGLTSGMTLEAWIYPTATLSTWPTIVMKERPGSFAYVLYANSSNARLSAHITSGGAGNEYGLDAGTRPRTYAWTHIAVTYDGATMRLYQNGYQVGSRTLNRTIDTAPGALSIGGNGIWPAEYFTGRIDDVRIYSRALTQSEVRTDMNTAVPRPGTTPGRGGAGGNGGVGGTGGRGGSGGSGGSQAIAGAGGRGGSPATTGMAGTGGMAVAGAGGAATGGRGGAAGMATGGRGGAAGMATGGRGGAAGMATGGRGGAAGMATAGAGGAAGMATGGRGGTTPPATSVYPLRLAPDARNLLDQSGRPFLMVGDSPWSLTVGTSLSEAELYLEDRRTRGFNTVLVNAIEHNFSSSPPRNKAGQLPFSGSLSNGALDFTTPVEAYWAYVDAVIRAAAARNILVLLAPGYLGYAGGTEGWWTEIQANGVTRMRTYGEWLGARYQSFDNIVWVAGGDFNPPDRSYTRALQEGIKSRDTRHLHTGHCAPQTAAMTCWSGESWLDIDNAYSYPQQRAVRDAVLAQWQRTDHKPVFYVEGAYELENSSTEQSLRQQSYEAVLSGAFGALYGHRDVWKFASGWQNALGSPGARDTALFGSLFRGLAWSGLAPDTTTTFLTGGRGSGATIASVALSADRRLAVTYTPTARTLTFDLGRMAGPVRARWVDPTVGSSVTTTPNPATGITSFTPAAANSRGAGDWVLVLEVTP